MPNISFANLEQLGSASNFMDDILELFRSPSLLDQTTLVLSRLATDP